MSDSRALRDIVGDPPVDDSLKAIDWMLRALAGMAGQVVSEDPADADGRKEQRAELLKIADRMAKLRDPDRMYLAEEALRKQTEHQEDSRPGPQLTDAPQIDTAPGQVTARRGRPTKRSLS